MTPTALACRLTGNVRAGWQSHAERGVDLRGIEPLTSCLPSTRSTN